MYVCVCVVSPTVCNPMDCSPPETSARYPMVSGTPNRKRNVMDLGEIEPEWELFGASLAALVVKNPPASAADMRHRFDP